MADKVVPTDARHLRKLSDIVTDKPLIHSYLISNDTRTRLLEEGITAVHAVTFLG